MPGPRPLATLFAIVAPILFACGTQTINNDQVEQVIADGIEAQTSARNVTVECPEEVEIEAGAKFTCTARAEGEQAPVEVTQKDDQGNVRWELKPRPSG